MRRKRSLQSLGRFPTAAFRAACGECRLRAHCVNSVFSLHALAAWKMLRQRKDSVLPRGGKTGYSCKAQQDKSVELTDCETNRPDALATFFRSCGSFLLRCSLRRGNGCLKLQSRWISDQQLRNCFSSVGRARSHRMHLQKKPIAIPWRRTSIPSFAFQAWPSGRATRIPSLQP